MHFGGERRKGGTLLRNYYYFFLVLCVDEHQAEMAHSHSLSSSYQIHNLMSYGAKILLVKVSESSACMIYCGIFSWLKASSIYCIVTLSSISFIIHLFFILHWQTDWINSPGLFAFLYCNITEWCHRVCRPDPATHAAPGEHGRQSRGRWAGWGRGRTPAAAPERTSPTGGGLGWGESRPCLSTPVSEPQSPSVRCYGSWLLILSVVSSPASGLQVLHSLNASKEEPAGPPDAGASAGAFVAPRGPSSPRPLLLLQPPVPAPS